MLTAPFYGEVPHDLGCDAAWLGRDVMVALLQKPRPVLTRETAVQKARLAEDTWKARDEPQ